MWCHKIALYTFWQYCTGTGHAIAWSVWSWSVKIRDTSVYSGAVGVVRAYDDATMLLLSSLGLLALLVSPLEKEKQ